MPKYQYAGETELVYPGFLLPEGGSLVARPGDVREFDEDPPPGHWVRVESKPAAKPAKAGE